MLVVDDESRKQRRTCERGVSASIILNPSSSVGVTSEALVVAHIHYLRMISCFFKFSNSFWFGIIYIK